MKTRLDVELGPLPPATIDVDALMARGCRQVRLRRIGTLGAVTGLTAVAVGAAVVVAATGTGRAPAGGGSVRHRARRSRPGRTGRRPSRPCRPGTR
jgi:hypothetical protein